MWGYLGTAIILYGAKLVGEKNILGWLWFILGDFLWIVEGINIQLGSGNPSVIICEALLLVLHIRGYFKWRNDWRYNDGNKATNG